VEHKWSTLAEAVERVKQLDEMTRKLAITYRETMKHLAAQQLTADKTAAVAPSYEGAIEKLKAAGWVVDGQELRQPFSRLPHSAAQPTPTLAGKSSPW